MYHSVFGNLDPRKTNLPTAPKPKEVAKKTRVKSAADGSVKPKRKKKSGIGLVNGRIDQLFKNQNEEPVQVKPQPIVDLASIEKPKTETPEEQNKGEDGVGNVFRLLKSAKREPNIKIKDDSSDPSSLLVYQRFEPTDWNQFVGNNQTIAKIRTWFDKVLNDSRYWPRALMLEGPVGVGKSLIPKLLAKQHDLELIHISCSSFWYENSAGEFPKDEQKLSQIFTQVRGSNNRKLVVLDDPEDIFDFPTASLGYFFDSKKESDKIAGMIAGWWADVQNDITISPPPLIVIFSNVYKSNIPWLRTLQKEYKDSKKDQRYKKKKGVGDTNKLTKKVLKAKFVTLDKVNEREISQNLNRIAKNSDLYYSDREMGTIQQECFGDVRKSILLLQEANWAFHCEQKNPILRQEKRVESTHFAVNGSTLTFDREDGSIATETEVTNKAVVEVKKISSIFSFWPFLVNLPNASLKNQKGTPIQTNLDRINDVIEEWGEGDPMLATVLEGKYLSYFSNFHNGSASISPLLEDFHDQTHRQDLSMVYSPPSSRRKTKATDKQIGLKVNKSLLHSPLLQDSGDATVPPLGSKRKLDEQIENSLKANPKQNKLFYSLSALYQYFEGSSFGDYVQSSLYRSRWDIDLMQTKITFEKTRPLLLLKSVCPIGLGQINWNDEIKPIQDTKIDWFKNQKRIKSVILHPSYSGLEDIEILDVSRTLLIKIWKDWNSPFPLPPNQTFWFQGEDNLFRERVFSCRKLFSSIEVPERRLGKLVPGSPQEIKENFLKSKSKVKPNDVQIEAFRDDYCWALLSFGYGAITMNNMISYWAACDMDVVREEVAAPKGKDKKQETISEIAKLLKKGTDASPPFIYRMDQFEKTMNSFGTFQMHKTVFDLKLTSSESGEERSMKRKASKSKKEDRESPSPEEKTNETIEWKPKRQTGRAKRTSTPKKPKKNEMMIGID